VKSPHIVIESLGLSSIIFEKSVSQESIEEKGNSYGERGQFLQAYFWGKQGNVEC
jgi:hypothetical protein